MTFITAIQLNDSIIITTDNKKAVLKENGEIQFDAEKTQKIYSWDQGIITGTGESYVISRAIEFFKKIAHSDITKLPQCLEISRGMREFEIGVNYFQVANTKLLCSSYSENGAQLYTIQRFETSQSYELMAVKPIYITVWLFHPNIDAISTDLQNIYSDLKDYAAFANQQEWVNYYINRIAPIYQKQSQVDLLMSQSFDIFFQTKGEYVFGHIPNTQNSAIELKEISLKSECI